MRYQYEAKSIDGSTSTGVLDAASVAEANRQLRARELFVLSLAPAGAVGFGTGRSGRGRRGKASKRDLLALTSQLAIMSRAGVPLATALENAAAQCPSPALKQALQQVHGEVLAGKAVSAAMGAHDHIFGPSYVAAIAAAETAGRLPEILRRLADLLQSELHMRSTLRTLLAYPILLFSVSLLVVAGLMFFVLPQFSGVFEQLGIPLPLITRCLIGLSASIAAHWWFWLALALGGAAGGVALLKSPTGRAYRDHFMLSLAVLRDVTQSLLIGRALLLLGTMIESGVPLLEGLRLTRSSIRNTAIKDLFRTLEGEVTGGRGMGRTFLNSPFVPAGAAQMVATAEQTGSLGAVTQMMGKFYEEEGESRLRELAAVLEPLIIIVMGILVAIVVMSVMLPIFDFATVTR